VLLRTEKMAAVGRLTAGFAHEMATPLASTLAALEDLDGLRTEYAESIDDGSVTPDDHRAIADEMKRAISLAETSSERASRFVRGIRAHTRDSGTVERELFDASETVVEAVELLGHAARAAHVAVKIERSAERVPIVGVASRLGQAVANLLQNAIDAAS